MCFSNSSPLLPVSVADAVEEDGDRGADEFIALDDLHTLFREHAAGGLDFFTRMGADVRRVDGKALTSELKQRQGCRERGAMCRSLRTQRGHLHGR